MENPFFTLIIPTFNSGKTLSAALESVLSQTFDNWNLWIVDGLSSDNTLEIAETQCSKDQRIRFVSEKDTGVYDAMNKGIQRAPASWLYFLGSDDRLYNEHVLLKVHAAILQADCDVLYGKIISEKNGRYGNPTDTDKLLINNISHQSMFFKKTVFTRLGLYDSNWKTHADWDFNLRLFSDPLLVTRYADIIVAFYAAGGLSSVHEIRFLQDVLWPRRQYALEMKPVPVLHSIGWFDEWWRFIRNAEIAKADHTHLDTPQMRPVRIILDSQKNLRTQSLKSGLVSKILMFFAYTKYVLRQIVNKV